MSIQADTPEERIILATIACINDHGISGATNRRISQLAGVNAAAINYYFRSKDVLIQRCMERTLENAFELSGMPPMPGLSAQERCIAIMIDLITGGHAFPGLTRAHFHELVTKGRLEPLLHERINRFIAALAEDLTARGTALAAEELRMALAQIFSSVLIATLAPTLFGQWKGLDLQDPDSIQAYVTRLVGHLLP